LPLNCSKLELLNGGLPEKLQLQIIPPYDILALVGHHENEESTCRCIGLQRYGEEDYYHVDKIHF
jgi:hypothetical protein